MSTLVNKVSWQTTVTLTKLAPFWTVKKVLAGLKSGKLRFWKNAIRFGDEVIAHAEAGKVVAGKQEWSSDD